MKDSCQRKRESLIRIRPQENQDYCNTCKNGGRFLCCDECPRSFHLSCTEPPTPSGDIPDGSWYCRECASLVIAFLSFSLLLGEILMRRRSTRSGQRRPAPTRPSSPSVSGGSRWPQNRSAGTHRSSSSRSRSGDCAPMVKLHGETCGGRHQQLSSTLQCIRTRSPAATKIITISENSTIGILRTERAACKGASAKDASCLQNKKGSTRTPSCIDSTTRTAIQSCASRAGRAGSPTAFSSATFARWRGIWTASIRHSASRPAATGDGCAPPTWSRF